MNTFARSLGTLLVLVLAAAVAGAQRLPVTAVPDHYELTFTPDLRNASFTGSETIGVRLTQPGRSIVLNAAEITFRSVTVTQEDRAQEATVSLDDGKEQATLTVPSPLAAGPATVRIEYSGTLNDKLRGFYLAHSKSRNYAITQFESTDARRAFPSLDEPALKATFSITLIVDKTDTAISNGPDIFRVASPHRIQVHADRASARALCSINTDTGF